MLMEHKGWEISHGNCLGFRLRGQERFMYPGRKNALLPLPDLPQDVEVVDVQRHNSGIFRIFFVGLVGWPVNDGGPASGSWPSAVIF